MQQQRMRDRQEADGAAESKHTQHTNGLRGIHLRLPANESKDDRKLTHSLLAPASDMAGRGGEMEMDGERENLIQQANRPDPQPATGTTFKRMSIRKSLSLLATNVNFDIHIIESCLSLPNDACMSVWIPFLKTLTFFLAS